MQTRQAEVNRKSKEADIRCALDLDGGGAVAVRRFAEILLRRGGGQGD